MWNRCESNMRIGVHTFFIHENTGFFCPTKNKQRRRRSEYKLIFLTTDPTSFLPVWQRETSSKQCLPFASRLASIISYPCCCFSVLFTSSILTSMYHKLYCSFGNIQDFLPFLIMKNWTWVNVVIFLSVLWLKCFVFSLSPIGMFSMMFLEWFMFESIQKFEITETRAYYLL